MTALASVDCARAAEVRGAERSPSFARGAEDDGRRANDPDGRIAASGGGVPSMDGPRKMMMTKPDSSGIMRERMHAAKKASAKSPKDGTTPSPAVAKAAKDKSTLKTKDTDTKARKTTAPTFSPATDTPTLAPTFLPPFFPTTSDFPSPN